MSTKEHYLKTELYNKLREDPKIFEWIEKGSLDGIWYWDLADGEQEWLSPKFKEVFGYEDGEIPNTSAWWQENIFEEDLALALENFDKHVADPGHPYDQIVRYRHKDGSTVWVRCRGLVMKDEQGNPIRMLGAHTNVTELKKAELDLEAKQAELARSNRNLEQFAFAASHDLKSPISAIKKLLYWIKEDSEEPLPESIQEHLANIDKRCNRMLALTTDLLRYSRLGDLSREREQISLKKVATDIFVYLNDGENFVLDVDDVDFVIERAPFELVLRNFISNAIKHHDKGQGQINVKCEIGESSYIFLVSDNGPGIPEKYHHQVVEMFQTLEPKSKTDSSGIGLAMVRKILISIGGELTILSDGNSGTTMKVVWPKNQSFL